MMMMDEDEMAMDAPSASSSSSSSSSHQKRDKLEADISIANSTTGGSSTLQKKAEQEKKTMPWVEKYRPNELQDLISHENIITTITRLIDQNRLPHLLFYGPPGTGKTSTILACARKLNGPKFKNMVLELNASDDRGIDVVSMYEIEGNGQVVAR